jgi:hypothetical protein
MGFHSVCRRNSADANKWNFTANAGGILPPQPKGISQRMPAQFRRRKQMEFHSVWRYFAASNKWNFTAYAGAIPPPQTNRISPP